MKGTIYIYYFLEWNEHKTGPAPCQEDFNSIGHGLLRVIKIENGKAHEAHESGCWVRLEHLT